MLQAATRRMAPARSCVCVCVCVRKHHTALRHRQTQTQTHIPSRSGPRPACTLAPWSAFSPPPTHHYTLCHISIHSVTSSYRVPHHHAYEALFRLVLRIPASVSVCVGMCMWCVWGGRERNSFCIFRHQCQCVCEWVWVCVCVSVFVVCMGRQRVGEKICRKVWFLFRMFHVLETGTLLSTVVKISSVLGKISLVSSLMLDPLELLVTSSYSVTSYRVTSSYLVYLVSHHHT